MAMQQEPNLEVPTILIRPCQAYFSGLYPHNSYGTQKIWYVYVPKKLPSGKRLHNYGKSPFSMGKSTISTGPWLQVRKVSVITRG